jgi:restriction endonuclease S subunit
MAINSVECACNQSICAATCHENWDNEFIYYVLKYCSENIQKQYGEGTSFKSISQSTFMNLPIPNVPYDAQVEFRKFIEQAEQTKASLNKGIEAIEAVIRSLIAESTTKV